jgi:hypothetical protein
MLLVRDNKNGCVFISSPIVNIIYENHFKTSLEIMGKGSQSSAKYAVCVTKEYPKIPISFPECLISFMFYKTYNYSRSFHSFIGNHNAHFSFYETITTNKHFITKLYKINKKTPNIIYELYITTSRYHYRFLQNLDILQIISDLFNTYQAQLS